MYGSQHVKLYQSITFRKENKHDILYKMLLTGKVLKIDTEESYFAVDADYGLDIIKFSEFRSIEGTNKRKF